MSMCLLTYSGVKSFIKFNTFSGDGSTSLSYTGCKGLRLRRERETFIGDRIENNINKWKNINIEK